MACKKCKCSDKCSNGNCGTKCNCDNCPNRTTVVASNEIEQKMFKAIEDMFKPNKKGSN